MLATRLFRLAASAALICIVPHSAYPQDGASGNAYEAGCRQLAERRPWNTYEEALAMGECAGAVGTLIMLGETFVERLRFCRPSNVTTMQAVAVVSKYMRDNPALMHQPFPLLAINSFRAAWPCR